MMGRKGEGNYEEATPEIDCHPEAFSYRILQAYEAITSPEYFVVDENGVRQNNARCKLLGQTETYIYIWLYADDDLGFQVQTGTKLSPTSLGIFPHMLVPAAAAE